MNVSCGSFGSCSLGGGGGYCYTVVARDSIWAGHRAALAPYVFYDDLFPKQLGLYIATANLQSQLLNCLFV